MSIYEYKSEDRGNYRVYYTRKFQIKENRKIIYKWFCIQNNGSWGIDHFVFCACSKDGEPSHEIAFPPSHHFDKLIFPPSLI